MSHHPATVEGTWAEADDYRRCFGADFLPADAIEARYRRWLAEGVSDYLAAFAAHRAELFLACRRVFGPGPGPSDYHFGRYWIRDLMDLEPVRIALTAKHQLDDRFWPGPPESLYPKGETLPPDRHPGFVIRGERMYPMRWDVTWSSIEPYHPQTAAEKKEQAIRREASAVRREAARMPLFADDILNEGGPR